MPAQREIKLVKRGIGELLDVGLEDAASINRTMLTPLIDVIRNATVTGRDSVDLKALDKKIEKTLTEMDESSVADWAEQMLLQTYAISRTASVPAEVPEDFDVPATTPEEELGL